MLPALLALLALAAAPAAALPGPGGPGLIAGLAYPWGLARLHLYGLEAGESYGLAVLNGVGSPVEFTLLAASKGFAEPRGPVSGGLVEFTARSESGVLLLYGIPPGAYRVVLYSGGEAVAEAVLVVAPLPLPGGPPDFTVLEPGDLEVYAAAAGLAEPLDYDVFAGLAADRDGDGVVEAALAGDVDLAPGDAAAVGALASAGLLVYSASPAGSARLSYAGAVGFEGSLALERVEAAATLRGSGLLVLRHSTVAGVEAAGELRVVLDHSSASVSGGVASLRSTASTASLAGARCEECVLDDSTLHAARSVLGRLEARGSAVALRASAIGEARLDSSTLRLEDSSAVRVELLNGSTLEARNASIGVLEALGPAAVAVEAPGASIDEATGPATLWLGEGARLELGRADGVEVEGAGGWARLGGVGAAAAAGPGGLSLAVVGASSPPLPGREAPWVEADAHAVTVLLGWVSCSSCRAGVVEVGCGAGIVAGYVEAGVVRAGGTLIAGRLEAGAVEAPGHCGAKAAVMAASIKAQGGVLEVRGPQRGGPAALSIAGSLASYAVVRAEGGVELALQAGPAGFQLEAATPGGGVLEAQVPGGGAAYVDAAGGWARLEAGGGSLEASCRGWRALEAAGALTASLPGCAVESLSVEAGRVVLGAVEAANASFTAGLVEGGPLRAGSLRLAPLRGPAVTLAGAAVEAGEVWVAAALEADSSTVNASLVAVEGYAVLRGSRLHADAIAAPMLYAYDSIVTGRLEPPAGWAGVYLESSRADLAVPGVHALIIAAWSNVTVSGCSGDSTVVAVAGAPHSPPLRVVVQGPCRAEVSRGPAVALPHGGRASAGEAGGTSLGIDAGGAVLGAPAGGALYIASLNGASVAVEPPPGVPACLAVRAGGNVSLVAVHQQPASVAVPPGIAEIVVDPASCPPPGAPETVIVEAPQRPGGGEQCPPGTPPPLPAPGAQRPVNLTITAWDIVVATTTVTETVTATAECNATTPQPPGPMEGWEAVAALAMLAGVAVGAVLPAAAARLARRRAPTI